MFAIDTNLVVRYLVADDRHQAQRARRLLDHNDVFVCTTVVLETAWVLRALYGLSADECADAITAFAGLPRVTLENAAAVAKALGWIRQGIDFADGLHLARAEESCEAFITFDQALASAANPVSGIRVRAP
jgi:predicted nucleic-acid-binding protein